VGVSLKAALEDLQGDQGSARQVMVGMAEFKEEPRGVLVSMDTGEIAGLSYVVWFPYTRKYISLVREGDLVAVRSFASQNGKPVYSILELVSVLPAHYALGTSSAEAEKAFPGFFLEAAKSARVDWEQEEPTEQTTKIRADAIPTGIQLVLDSNRQPSTASDESLPMIGEEANLLTDELTNRIINKGLLGKDILTIAPCDLVLNPSVEVRLSVDDLLKLHFGVFGFTGSGKSNLMSTLVDAILGTNKPLKVCVFDLMAEYGGLLIDLLDKIEDAYIIAFGEDSIPGGQPTVDFLYGRSKKPDDAAEAMVRTLLLPKDLVGDRAGYLPAMKRLLTAGKLRIYYEGPQATRIDDIRTDFANCISGNLGGAKNPLNQWIEDNLSGQGYDQVPKNDIERMINELDGFLNTGIPETFAQAGSQRSLMGGSAPAANRVALNATARSAVLAMKAVLQKRVVEPATRPPEEAMLSHFDIEKLLNSKGGPALLIFQSNRDDELRTDAARLVLSIFNGRRRLGTIDPQILFVYDEADEFIPGSGREGESYALSKTAAATLARRGRKFGLGMAIATQRVAYLDTSILAQPHTYFISKMPREYDREAIANAFGATEEMMRKTLKFSKGQWLLVSYDATGLVNVPLPVQLRNANERIRAYLRAEKG
jgi:hypothetical protein